jgi:hypothetical protein
VFSHYAQVPNGLSRIYLDAVHAVYSIGLTLDRVRPEQSLVHAVAAVVGADGASAGQM